MFDAITSELSKLRQSEKYEPVRDTIYVHGKCLYVIGRDMAIEVDLSSFTDTCFDKPIKMPLCGDFELSDNVTDQAELALLSESKKHLNKHCDTLIFFNKQSVVEYIRQLYGSHAKANKVIATLDIGHKVAMTFRPIKKSTSVFQGAIDENIVIKPRPRIRAIKSCINVKLLPLSLALDNLLLADTVKLEIDRDCQFLRISCFHNGLRVKFSILNNECSNF